VSELTDYLDAIKLSLISSPVIAAYTIIKERTTATDGYIRLRATLVNGDFLELTEYFVSVTQVVQTVDYRYQWMDANQTHLRQRRDNTPHHPELPDFPHHSHLENDTRIVGSQPLSLCQLLEILKTRLDR
jgi:hypothetical protein